MTRSQKDQALIHNFRTFYPIQKNVGFLFRVSNNSEYQGDFHPICWRRQRGKDSAQSGYFRRWNLWVLGISLDVCFRDTVQVSGGLGVRLLSMIMRSLGVELESRASGTQIFKKKKKGSKRRVLMLSNTMTDSSEIFGLPRELCTPLRMNTEAQMH